MIKQIQISNFKEVQKIVSAASGCLSDIGVHDMRGSIADAKSILRSEEHTSELQSRI